MNEVAVFWDGANVVTSLGPGRHMLTAETTPTLTPFFDDKEVFVCFVTTTTVNDFEVQGPLSDDEDDEDFATIALTLRVTDPPSFVAKAVELEEDEDEDEDVPSMEDWIASEVLDAVCDLLDEGGSDDVGDDLPGRVAPALSEAGVELMRVESVELPEN